MTKELAERLRDWVTKAGEKKYSVNRSIDLLQAADAIESLEQRLKTAEGDLQVAKLRLNAKHWTPVNDESWNAALEEAAKLAAAMLSQFDAFLEDENLGSRDMSAGVAVSIAKEYLAQIRALKR
jgi:hypothetical protein